MPARRDKAGTVDHPQILLSRLPPRFGRRDNHHTATERAWPRESDTRQRYQNSIDEKIDHAFVPDSPADVPTYSRHMHKRTRNWRLSGYDPKADESTIATDRKTEPRLAVLPAFELEDPWLHDRAG